MANDVSCFKVQGDATTYSFNDADLEARIGATALPTTAQTVTGAIAEHESDISALNTGKAPKSHASTASTYGLGTTSNYGHVKTVNGLTTSAHADGLALSAYQGKVLNDSISTLNSNIMTGKSQQDNFTSSTSFSYTGSSFTIPANKGFIVKCTAIYMNARPDTVAIYSSNSSGSEYASATVGNNHAHCTYLGRSPSASITLYAYAKYSAASTNRIEWTCLYIPA